MSIVTWFLPCQKTRRRDRQRRCHTARRLIITNQLVHFARAVRNVRQVGIAKQTLHAPILTAVALYVNSRKKDATVTADAKLGVQEDLRLPLCSAVCAALLMVARLLVALALQLKSSLSLVLKISAQRHLSRLNLTCALQLVPSQHVLN